MLILILLNYFIETLVYDSKEKIPKCDNCIDIKHTNIPRKSVLNPHVNVVRMTETRQKGYLIYYKGKPFNGILYNELFNVEITYKTGEPNGRFIYLDSKGNKSIEGYYNGIKIFTKIKELKNILGLKDLDKKDGKYYFKGILYSGKMMNRPITIKKFRPSLMFKITGEKIYISMVLKGKVISSYYLTLYEVLQDGKQKSWYENGKKESEGYYKNGALDGKQKSWDENGNYYGYSEYKDGKRVKSLFASISSIRPYEEKAFIKEILYENNEKIQTITYFSDYDKFSKNDIYKDGEVIEFWSKKDGISYPYKNKQKNKLLNHYKNSYGIPYIIKGMRWCYKRYDEYLDDFIINKVSYMNKKDLPLGSLYRSFSCKNDKCKVIYYMYSDIKKANKYWEFDLKLEGGYFFPIIYIFEREIDLKEKNNDKLKYMLSC